ncbi:hypothetical protein [Nodosilinea sp. E11]|uniref:hypothetical protein n=1 Tax=Nodosilinea sp. E11 TaxID=3037479 RepID=UPI00293439BA|nr:hypothetical protein [Nodosilinea sp. E11]WOD40869.1 hypothetical protein RRF56_08680 [Nodosilinea sp. E11]
MAAPAQASNQSTNGHIQGNVDVAPGVAIAPGVLLGAAPGCRLVVSAGVCLGADVVIQAHHGDLVLEPGVSLGSGVLVVGHGFIGQHTCIGANSTLINPVIGASQVVAPSSLMGDPSQPTPPQPGQANGSSPGFGPSVRKAGGSTFYSASSDTAVGHAQTGGTSNGNSLNGSASAQESIHSGTQNGNTQNGNTQNGSSVYGKSQVNRLLATLFPQRQALNGASPEDRP